MIILKPTKEELHRFYLLLANTWGLTRSSPATLTLCGLWEIYSLPFSGPMRGAPWIHDGSKLCSLWGGWNLLALRWCSPGEHVLRPTEQCPRVTYDVIPVGFGFNYWILYLAHIACLLTSYIKWESVIARNWGQYHSINSSSTVTIDAESEGS